MIPALGLRAYLGIGVGVIILVLSTALYIEHLRVKEAKAQITNLKVANQIQQQTIVNLEKANVAIQNINSDISKIIQSNALQFNELIQGLVGLEESATKNPVETEKKINDSFDHRIRCFALVTGDKLKKDETNPVCPQVIKRLKKHEK